jgi:RNA polymerase sigma factor (sigma-70 family)
MSPRKKVSPSKTPATKVPSQKKRVLEPEVLPREEEKQDDDDEREDEEHEGEIEAFEADAPKTESHLPALSTPDDLPETTAVSLADPLRRYMEEVKLHPLLTPEDEFKLAVELKETGSIEAAKKLVQANLRLVVKIAFEYRSIYTNILDLVQEGNIGLMKAVSKYDPSKGARLELVKVDGASVRVVAQSMRTVDRIEALLRERGVMAVRDIADELLESTDRAAIDRVRRALETNKRIFREYSDKTWSLVNWQPARRPDDRPAMRIINAV